MTPNRSFSWWLRKRVWLPLLFLLCLAVALVVAIAASNTSKIIVYNQTGTSIGALKLTACGQEIVLRNLDDEESFHWKLPRAGAPGEIVLEIASDPPWRWQGGYIEPQSGYRVTIRLWPDGEIESHTQISFWQRLLHDQPNLND